MSQTLEVAKCRENRPVTQFPTTNTSLFREKKKKSFELINGGRKPWQDGGLNLFSWWPRAFTRCKGQPLVPASCQIMKPLNAVSKTIKLPHAHFSRRRRNGTIPPVYQPARCDFLQHGLCLDEGIHLVKYRVKIIKLIGWAGLSRRVCCCC
jgi:hypothetical protein